MFRIELVFHYHQLAQTGQGSLKPCGYEAKLTPAPENHTSGSAFRSVAASVNCVERR